LLDIDPGLIFVGFEGALYRADPVFILGQGAGLFVYARNLYFIYNRRREQARVAG